MDNKSVIHRWQWFLAFPQMLENESTVFPQIISVALPRRLSGQSML